MPVDQINTCYTTVYYRTVYAHSIPATQKFRLRYGEQKSPVMAPSGFRTIPKDRRWPEIGIRHSYRPYISCCQSSNKKTFIF